MPRRCDNIRETTGIAISTAHHVGSFAWNDGFTRQFTNQWHDNDRYYLLNSRLKEVIRDALLAVINNSTRNLRLRPPPSFDYPDSWFLFCGKNWYLGLIRTSIFVSHIRLVGQTNDDDARRTNDEWPAASIEHRHRHPAKCWHQKIPPTFADDRWKPERIKPIPLNQIGNSIYFYCDIINNR